MNWDRIKDVTIAILVIACIILALSTTCSSRHNKEYRNNIEALTDSINVYKLKNGELLYSKKMLIGDLSNAEQQLGVTKKQLKEIEKQLDAKITQIAKLKGQIKVDTIVMHDSVYVQDSVLKSDFNYRDKWLTMEGTVNIKDSDSIKTQVNLLAMNVELDYYVTDKNEVAAKSACDYLKINELSGIQAAKKERIPHWNLGIQVGFGAQYNLVTNKFGYGPYIGVGISYGWCFK